MRKKRTGERKREEEQKTSFIAEKTAHAAIAEYCQHRLACLDVTLVDGWRHTHRHDGQWVRR